MGFSNVESSVANEIWDTVWRGVRNEIRNLPPHEVRVGVLRAVDNPLDRALSIVWVGLK